MNAFYIFAIALLVATIAALLGAVYLQLATRIVAGFKPTYKDAYSASFIAGFIFAAAIGIGCLAGVIPADPWKQVNVTTVAIFFVVHLCVYSGQLIHPDLGYVGMGRASVIVLMQNVIAVVAWSVVCWTFQKPAPLDQLGPQLAEFTNRSPDNPPSPQQATFKVHSFINSQQAQSEAVRRYPDLGVEGSMLHREFLTRYRRYLKENPSYFEKASWPVELADEAAKALY